MIKKVKFLDFIYFLLLVAVLGLLCFVSFRGFDFTDEGYYLQWIKSPFVWPIKLSAFGFFFHPFFIFLNKDVFLLRLLFSAFIVFLYSKVTRLFTSQFFENDFAKIINIFFLPLSLLLFNSFILTPNYNILNIIGFLFFAFSILYSNNKSPENFISYGFAGAIVFLAKASSAVLLFLVFAFYFISNKKKILILKTMAVSFLFVFLFSIYSDGNFFFFLKSFLNSYKLLNVLRSNYSPSSILRLDGFNVGLIDFLSGIAIFVFSFLKMKKIFKIVCIMCFIFFIKPHVFFINTAIFSTLLIVLYLVVNKFCFNNDLKLSCIFLILPYCFAFGTDAEYLKAAVPLSCFWVISLFLIVKLHFKDRFDYSFYAFVSSFIALIHVYYNIQNPYRQDQPIYNQSFKTKIADSYLFLSKDFSKYIKDAQILLRNKNYCNENILDLTGKSAGLIYAVGARSAVFPWLSGSHPGSTQYIRILFSMVSLSDLLHAWIITEDNKDRSIDPSILQFINRDLKKDYDFLGFITAPPHAAGSVKPRIQFFWKPKQRLLRDNKNCVNS